VNNQDKASINQVITDLYSRVAIKLDPTNSKDKDILNNLRVDITNLKTIIKEVK
jgi:hypothetical protein